ncbi:MAG: type VI secretion system baseplate subunit TssK [Candidatus Thiodiazotropha sp. (ex Dulcina madagascariensis)]|nr:type VI secretion system baseplate subunit TssK [Candidatus Thiodiazotropha sp. (ex Epidulcina cf. delphinae)]MCU7921257.1 type VI secretion system baseplate subunit TssK [Candidatus Thiodiazotropha sp. (ex Dulcina madagascariensis)]MCU7927982.1 type VI secretion system baseplate subunit TssK [Candidatus Thiodiazotropha sp. (ex Dulcina madagascariensis)]
MSWMSRIVWSEGMFLRPHHFQQQERFLEHRLQARCADLTPYSWGFTHLKIDRQALALGRLALESCRGVLPDGTTFDIPGNDNPPPPLDIPAEHKGAVVYLALPLSRPGTANVRFADQEEGLERYVAEEIETKDGVSGSSNTSTLQVAKPTVRLLIDSSELEEFAHLAVAKIIERRSDDMLLLDEDFIPPCLDCEVSARLAGYVKEIEGLLHHRADAIASRLVDGGKGIAEVADFLMLQVVNRYEPLYTHFSSTSPLHPTVLYEAALQLAGELATFTSSSKRPPAFAIYQHHALQETFTPVIRELRRSLSMVLEQKAVAIPLEERKYGIRVATVPDPALLSDASFVLAVNAHLAADALQRRFPSQTKIGPVEKIRDLVNLQLPGIGLRILSVAPRQIPYNAGFSYFELDKNNEYWNLLETSGGCAIHIGGEFPGLELELWAIKGS